QLRRDKVLLGVLRKNLASGFSRQVQSIGGRSFRVDRETFCRYTSVEVISWQWRYRRAIRCEGYVTETAFWRVSGGTLFCAVWSPAGRASLRNARRSLPRTIGPPTDGTRAEPAMRR